MTIIRPLQGGPPARYLPAAGMMLVAQSADHLIDQLTTPVADAHQSRDRLVFIHEAMHHLQVLSSSWLFNDAIDRLRMAQQMLLPNGRDVRQAAADRWRRSDQRFRHRFCGVSVRDLCEGSAVLESYRAMSPRHTPESFVTWRNSEFPGKGNSAYRRTFDIVAEELSPAAAFELLPVLTYVALNADVPGQMFDQLLGHPFLRSPAGIGASLAEITQELGLRLPRLTDVVPSQPDGSAPALCTVLLHSYAAVPGDPKEAFARPHQLLHGKLINDFAPPVVVGSYRFPPTLGQRVPIVAFGAAEDNIPLQLAIFGQTAMVEAARRLVTGRTGPVACPHTTCPNHSGGLCGGWFFPLPDDAEDCLFRLDFHQAAGTELHESATSFIQEIDVTTALPAEPRFPPGAADRFDDRHLLDPEDNDQVLVLSCEHCGALRAGRMSERGLTLGFDYRCQACGRSGRFTSAGVPRFMM